MKLKPFLLAMLLASLLSALPSHAERVDNFNYNLNSATYTAVLTGAIDKNATTIDIPSVITYNGNQYEVTTIGSEAFYNYYYLTTVYVPNTVTAIEKWAFGECRNLQSINIPESVTTIGNQAFRYCTALESIEIPSSVSSMGINPFDGCRSLREINVDIYNEDYKSEDGVLFDKNGKTLICYPAQRYGTSYSVPNGVETTDWSAFAYAQNLTTVEFPNTLTTIGQSAFYMCQALTSVTVPASVTTLGRNSFGSSSVTSVNLLASISKLEDSMFYGCKNLTRIELPESITEIDYNVFQSCSALKSVKLPHGLTSIGNQAFYGCSSLESIEIPEAVNSIGTMVFTECYALSEVIYNASNLSNSGLGYNSGLPSRVASLTIGNNVQRIPNYMFANGARITSLVLPGSVSSIGSNAFCYCSLLESVTCEGTVPPTLGSQAFYQSNKCPLYVPKGCAQAYSDAGYDNWFSSIEAMSTPGITVSYIGEGTAIINGKNIEIAEPIDGSDFEISFAPGVGWKLGSVKLDGADITSQVADNQITLSDITSDSTLDIEFVSKTPYLTFSYTDSTLKAYVKCNDTSIAQAEIPAEISHNGQIYNVTGLDSRAFYGCSNLTSIEIPNSISYIGDDSFSSCSKLTSIRLPSAITSISSGTFNRCSSLISLEIPNSVTSIGDWAFNGCNNLTSIVIPNSVTSIGSLAFKDCYGLVSVVFEPDVPPTHSNSFTNSQCVAYVHRSSRQAYLNAGYATYFKALESLESLTVNYTGNGEVLCEGNAIGNGTVYEDGEAFDFIVLPNDGWKIQSVTLDGEDISGQLVNHHLAFTAPAAKSILDILFAEDAPVAVEPTYATLSVTNNSGHTHTHYYVEGHDAKIAFTPQENWELHSVTLNDEDVTCRLENNMLTIPAIAGDNTLDVVYRENKATSVEKASLDQLQIRVANKTVTITGKEAGETVRIYDEQGAMLYMGTDSTIALGVKDCIILINVRGETYKAMLH